MICVVDVDQIAGERGTVLRLHGAERAVVTSRLCVCVLLCAEMFANMRVLLRNPIWRTATICTMCEQSIVVGFVAYIGKYMQVTFGLELTLATRITGASSTVPFASPARPGHRPVPPFPAARATAERLCPAAQPCCSLVSVLCWKYGVKLYFLTVTVPSYD